MTVSSSTNRVSHSGNGTLTAVAYTCKVFDESDLTVILRASDGTETVQTITTHYTVSGVGDAGGGNVTFVTAPASGVTVVILREQPLTQGLDLVPNDPFPANSLEEALDKIVFMTQKHEEELGRAIKASRTNVITGSEFTISASDRANKVFAFDSSGDVSITSELGVYRGNWAASVAYNQRDIVKDTSNNNIYLANTAHTSSGSTPLSSNADIAKWDLLVDAAAASTSASAAATSATAAQTAQTAAETAQTAAETAQTASETAQTASEAAQAAAELAYDNFDDRYLGAKASDPTLDNDGGALITGALYFNTTSGMKVYDGAAWDDVKPTTAEQANIDAVAADATDIGTVATNISNVNTVAGISGNVTTVAGISADVTTVAADGTDIGTVATNIANVNAVGGISANVTTVAGISANVTTVAGISANVTTVAGDTANIGTIATNLNGTDTIGTVAGSISNVNSVGGSITNVNTVATNLTSINSFANTYRIGTTDPTTSLDTGDLFFNTSSGVLKVYTGSAWEAGVTAGSGFLPLTGGTLTGGLTGTTATFTGDLTVDTNTLYVDSTNNRVGMGTSSPDELLHIHGATQSYIKLTDNDSGQGATDGALFAFDGNSATQYIWNYENGPTVFATNSSERMRIDSSGNVGIGTTAPNNYSANHKSITLNAPTTPIIDLEVNGTRTGSIVAESTKFDFNAVTSVPVRFLTADTERMRIDSSGRVGVGTTSPSSYDGEAENLVVASSVHTGITIASTGSNQRTNLYFSDGTSGTAAYIGGFTYDHSNDNLLTRTGGSERMRIDSSGNLLVGTTTSPSGSNKLVLAKGLVENTTTVSYAASIGLTYDNGSIQTVTLTGNVTFTDSLADGESVVLMLNAGASYTVTWPTMTWTSSSGNVAPTLTANDTLVFWKIGSTLYGAYAGSYT
jgi:hypothetical protein